MKTFEVHLYYSGSIIVKVNADDKSHALELAEAQVDRMSDEDFVSDAEFLSTGHDIYESNID